MAIVTKAESASTSTDDVRRYELASPATREPIGELIAMTDAEVGKVVERARAAAPAWAALSFAERRKYIDRALKILVKRQDEFIETIVRESGKARTDAILIDIFASCDSLAYYGKRTEAMLASEKLRPHGMLRFVKSGRLEYRPVGVVGIISPWNGPVILSLNPSVQALMAGNAVVVKPSEVTPASGRIVAELFEEAGLPDGVLTVIDGDGQTGAALIDAGVDKISFTGSVATGRKIAEACARRLIPYTLELGGKDAMVVLPDADIDVAAGAAVAGGMINTGQYCCGTERIYVPAEIAEDFSAKVVDKVAGLRQADAGEFDIGAICQARQIEIVEDHVNDAVDHGAKVRVGGRRNPDLDGLFYEPTVLTDVDNDMRIMREETFGPVLAIVAVESTEEAIALANDSEYGLSGTVWSRDLDTAHDVARRLDTGSICINDMPVAYGVLEAPFGGRKNSGVGQVNAAAGPRGYCHALPIITDRFGGKQAAEHYPYSAKTEKMYQRLIKIMWGTPLGKWLS